MSRLIISNTSDWELVDGAQDVRGFAALDGTGAAVGRVAAMIADTDAEIISAVVLDTGDEIPAFDLTIGDGVVYLAGSIPGAATATDAADFVHRGVAPRPVRVVPEADAFHADFRDHHETQAAPDGPDFAALDAAYRYGYAAAHADAHRNRTYGDAEPDLRAAYPAERDFEAEREAVRYGYRLAQHGRG